MIPTEILRRVGRKARQVLSPTGPPATPADPSPAAVQPEPSPARRPEVFDRYTEPGDLDDLGVLFMPLAAYHGRELGAIADALAAEGRHCTFLVEDDKVEVIDEHVGDHARILAASGYDRFAIGHFDAFVAMNDWGEPSRAIYHLARVRGVPSFAKVEGVQDFTDVDTGRIRLPYLAADHVLVQGDNDLAALDRKNLHVVGNANMETSWRAGVAPEPRNGSVVINSNFTYGVLTDHKERFLREAVAGVEASGLEPVISQHPADGSLPAGLSALRASTTMSALIPECEAVVTRFSTVPFEAIARGTPFVYFNPHDEQVPAFAAPDPAFRHVHSQDDLTIALREAVDTRPGYRDRAEAFFRAQVDMTDRPSAARAAEVIARIVYG